ncbi:16S rRNA (adenine(1518)-N(6)/adenine(1519)-N(6))-dimethyltransferase RsmA [Buchnera aphidicola (Takecallis taiwana)]|uniref:16S rRNA (adenine(1518)-N(6)/adenine(1519)-N(6))- dimethyltransferase RsmA n=1 Tax=Buchnera aphidicola TaxID=9 RepID=UPI0031B6F131
MYKNLFNKYIPKKYLGQHFLKDKNIVDKIITFIYPKKQDILVEIGSGLGALTKPVCNFIDHLVVIEVDYDLLLSLRKYSFYNKLTLVNKNVMHVDFKKLSIQKKNMLRIFGNIPYNISIQLILYLIQFRQYIFDMNFMVQKEVADRLIACPGNKKYGRLSVIAQSYYTIEIAFNITPHAFYPQPKVHSSFIKIKPKFPALYPWRKIHILEKITCLAFQKRRKILKNSLLNIIDTNNLMKLNINPNVRAENISVQEYCKIANFLFKSKYFIT